MTDPQPPISPKKPSCVRAFLQYFLFGMLIGHCAGQLGILRTEHAELFAGIVGALLGLTRLKRLVCLTAGALAICLMVIAYTPLVNHLAPTLRRSDPLHPAPAVVVLSSFQFKDQTLSSSAQERALHGYEILGQGYAPRLVLTHGLPPAGSWENVIRHQLAQLGLHPAIDIVGPVQNTHDEALAVVALAHEQGWKEVILVTHPWHMRRAAAVFESAGIHVICSPCAEGRYDFNHPQTPADRLGIFRCWLHETIGYRVYQVHGWIK